MTELVNTSKGLTPGRLKVWGALGSNSSAFSMWVYCQPEILGVLFSKIPNVPFSQEHRTRCQEQEIQIWRLELQGELWKNRKGFLEEKNSLITSNG